MSSLQIVSKSFLSLKYVSMILGLVCIKIFCHWQIYFKKKKTGGISFNSTMPLTHVDEKLCYQILHEYKIHNAEVPLLFFVIQSNDMAL